MRLATLWISFSLLIVGCGIVRPDTNMYIVNSGRSEMRGYNLLHDYDNNGNLKPGVPERVVPLASLDDLNKHTVTDPDGLANLKAYARQVREAYERCMEGRRVE
jgi:hypothetical protein